MMPHSSSPSDQETHAVRVLLVDDSEPVRLELRKLLELSGVIQVVGEARDGQQGILLAAKLTPDVVIMDLEMPGMDGFEATRRIKVQVHAPRIVILSMHAGPENEARARSAGATEFLVKGADFQVLINTILRQDGSIKSNEKGEKT
jgi:NarL family two-component system response regulator LiaR